MLVAGRVGAGGGLSQHPAEVTDGGGGEGVAVVSTPMTPSTSSASMAIAVVLLVWGRPWSASAWEESPRGTTVTGHNPCRVGQAADQASEVGQADAGTTADSSDLKATHRVPVAQRVIPRCQRQSLTAILPDCPHTLTVAQSA